MFDNGLARALLCLGQRHDRPIASGHIGKEVAYLCNHHVAVERPSSIDLHWRIDVRPELSHDGSAKGQVRYEVAW